VNLLIAIVGLMVLILIHEAGHFFTGLAVGIRPRKFSLGFGPALAHTTRNGIEYAVSAIPAGGYVRFPGMHRPAAKDVDVNFGPALREAPELQPVLARVEAALEREELDEARRELPALKEAFAAAELSRVARRSAERGLRDLEESLAEDAYWRAPVWKRIAVVSAGPLTNIVFAIVLLAAVYLVGVPYANSRTVEQVQAGRPAAAIGLRPGDTIVAVGGVPTPTFDAVRRRIQASRGRPITITVERDGRRLTLGPARPVRSGDRWVVGFVPGIATRSYGPGTAFRYAVNDCWQAVKGMGLAVAGLFHKEERGQLTSTVGIVRVSSNALDVSWALYLQILGFVSLSLALLNLLPLLPLDGGHILFSVIEGVRGRAVAREVYERASVIGFAIILLIAVIALNNDLSGNGPG
jgi:regulator of sigma E protease